MCIAPHDSTAMAQANADDGGAQSTSSIGDMLDMGLGDNEWPHDFDWGEDSDEVYRTFEDEERSVAFDILWDETETYPREIDDEVVAAILDDTDHWYLITYEDQTRRVSATGLALYAYLDDDADVEVSDE